MLIISLLLFIKNKCPTEWLCQRTFMKGYWACIQILAITNDIAVYVTLWVFMWILILYFSNINIWSGTVVLYSKYTFNFVKSDESLFSNGYAVLLSHHQDGSIPVAPHACQPMMGSVRLALLATSPSGSTRHFLSDVQFWTSLLAVLFGNAYFKRLLPV